MSGCGDFVSVSMIILLGFGAVIKACFFHIYCRVVLKQRAEIEVFLSGQNVTSLRKHIKLPRIQNSLIIAITLTDDTTSIIGNVRKHGSAALDIYYFFMISTDTIRI